MIIAQLSDAHIADGQDGPSKLFHSAVDHLMHLPARPDVVIITGDCVDNGRPGEYEQFQALLRPLSMPVYIIPGNHDDRARFLATFGTQGEHALDGFAQYTVEGWPVRLIALDTHIPGQGAGVLCEQRLAWLDERLAEQPTKPTLILMHHPPFLTGLAVPDGIGLQTVDALGAVVSKHPQIERIVAGHVHFMMTQRFHGSIVMTCPATTQHMLPDFHQPERLVVRMQTPSCLLHVWNNIAGLMTIPSVIGEDGTLVEIHDGTGWVA